MRVIRILLDRPASPFPSPGGPPFGSPPYFAPIRSFHTNGNAFSPFNERATEFKVSTALTEAQTKTPSIIPTQRESTNAGSADVSIYGRKACGHFTEHLVEVSNKVHRYALVRGQGRAAIAFAGRLNVFGLMA
jgi:hypothetical protein